MSIRPVEARDYSEWLRLRCALWPEVQPGALSTELEEMLDPGGNVAAFVCDRPGGGLQGLVETSIRSYAEGCESNHVGYVEAWYVDVDVRRRGLGAALIRAAEDWARGRGCTEMASDTEISNHLGKQAHLALGFSQVERIICFAKKL